LLGKEPEQLEKEADDTKGHKERSLSGEETLLRIKKNKRGSLRER